MLLNPKYIIYHQEEIFSMQKVKRDTVLGTQIEFRLDKQNGEYIISVFYAGQSEIVSFPDIEDENNAWAMFEYVANGHALPGTVKDVLEDYSFRIT